MALEKKPDVLLSRPSPGGRRLIVTKSYIVRKGEEETGLGTTMLQPRQLSDRIDAVTNGPEDREETQETEDREETVPGSPQV
jgi:hypothetical protein